MSTTGLSLKLKCKLCDKEVAKRVFVKHQVNEHGVDCLHASATWLHLMYFHKLDIGIICKCLETGDFGSSEHFDLGHLRMFYRYYNDIVACREFNFDLDYPNFRDVVIKYYERHPKVNNSRELCNLVFPNDVELAERLYAIKLEHNPFKGHGSELSPFSSSFNGYSSLPSSVVDEKLANIMKRRIKTMNENHNNPCRVDYFTSRGFSESDAAEQLVERQRTFTLEKCVEKYGKEIGTEIYRNRQIRWQNTMRSKGLNETERIIKSRLAFSMGYSRMSQEMFWKLYELVKDSYKSIWFATLDRDTGSRVSDNREYVVEVGNRHFLVDFFVEDLNAMIEFDGSYWHRNREYDDSMRDEILSGVGYKILRVKEEDYISDATGTLNRCILFLKECEDRRE